MYRVLFIVALALSFFSAPAAAQRPQYDGEAPVAFMYDMSSGAVLWSRDADRRIPPASMAKMMTVHVVFALIKEGEHTLDEECQVRPDTWRQWHSAGSTMFLSAGERVSIENLLHGVVTVSGNDASVVLAECISGTESSFTALMNRKAEELGLTNSHFGNATGWPDEGRTYVTARDLAKLAVATIRRYPDLYQQFYARRDFTWGRTMGGGNPISQPNRNPLFGSVDGADGLKTGHTEEAGYGFTGSAVQDGRRLVEVIAGLGSYRGRITEATHFMDWGFNAWDSRTLFSQGAQVGTARVQLGGASEVGLVAPRNLSMTVPAGLASEREVSIVYRGPVKAPIAQGQHIADLVVKVPGMKPQHMPLVAAEAVGEQGFFGRIWAGLKALLGLG